MLCSLPAPITIDTSSTVDVLKKQPSSNASAEAGSHV
jgi:hypothetical protein